MPACSKPHNDIVSPPAQPKAKGVVERILGRVATPVQAATHGSVLEIPDIKPSTMSNSSEVKTVIRNLESFRSREGVDPEAIDRLIGSLRTRQEELESQERPTQDPLFVSPPKLQQVVHAEAGRKGAWSPDLEAALPNSSIVVDNRAVFETDHLGRTVRAVTVLDQLAAGTDRNAGQQRAAGGADRLATDDGGHIFATLFGGLGESINVQAMDLSINRGAYRQLERLWAQQVEDGGVVHVEVSFRFSGDSRRPDEFDVTFNLDNGDAVSIPFYQ